MNFIEFYKELVDKNPPQILREKVLPEISEEVKNNMSKKCYMFSITEDKHLLSHKFTYANTAIAELTKGSKVVLVSKLEPFKKIILNQVKASLQTVKLTKYTDEYWILSV